MINDELIDTIANLDKVVKYIDIPLQHSNPQMLEAMRRPFFDYKEMINKMRSRIPNLTLRTTFIVGYPGETEEQFNDLYKFVEEMKFDKMGVFEYSREENTISYSMDNQIPEKIKAERKEKLMELQSKISLEINQSLIGKKIPCIIEALTQEGTVIARTYRDAPEIDGLVYAKAQNIPVPGEIVNVKISGFSDYDLFGVIC